MKKLMIIAVLVSTVLTISSNAFAHWNAPVGIEIHDPAIIPAVEAQISLR